MNKALLIQKDKVTATFIKLLLRDEGYELEHVIDLEQGLDLLTSGKEQLAFIIIDFSGAYLEGINLCKKVRKRGNFVPILVLSDNKFPDVLIKSLEAGADDCLLKPVDLFQLAAKVKTFTRRYYWQHLPHENPTMGNIVLDLRRYEVQLDQKSLLLTSTEFKLLLLLVNKKDQVVTQKAISINIWSDPDVDRRYGLIRTYIKQLRKKLYENGATAHIQTVRDVGYIIETSS